LGVCQDNPISKGTAVDKDYQTAKIDTTGIAVPDRVSVAMTEIAADLREGLLALAVGAGMQVLTAMMEADVAAVAGRRGKRDPGRRAVRHGHERGSVVLGGRRVPVARPRASPGGCQHCAWPGRTHSHWPGAMIRVTWSTSCRNSPSVTRIR
jgi:putative transposase